MSRASVLMIGICCALGITGCADEAATSPEPPKPAVEYLTAQQNEVMHASNFTYELITPDFTRAYPADS